MRVYHQCGHNFVWNIQSYRDDAAGDGFIISPVNIQRERLTGRFSDEERSRSLFDPQFYLPDDAKNHLSTYPFHPGVAVENFSTSDYLSHAGSVAEECVAYQKGLGFKYITIPTRSFEDLPRDHFDQLGRLFRDPFVNAWLESAADTRLLMTIVAKPPHVLNDEEREVLLTWATSVSEVSGVYLIFDNDFSTKQIKEPEYLYRALGLIADLRDAGMEVHVGYSNVEALLYSVADPTSISMGSFENLRSFGTLRLETRERSEQRGPRPRVYSGRLLQWIEDRALPPLRRLYPDWEELFDESPYRDDILSRYDTLHFMNAALYKHHFFVLQRQVRELPNEPADRAGALRSRIAEARELFQEIAELGIVLDPESDGSHLVGWLNALAMFEADRKGQ